MGNDSATGVLFTRDPSTGARGLYGDYLTNAQGEDVVAGVRTPKPIAEMQKEFPECYSGLESVSQKLEAHYREPQDIEFTVERGKLYLLQTRAAKMGPMGAVRAAVDMVHEGVITKEEALLRIAPEQLEQLLHPRVDPGNKESRSRWACRRLPGPHPGRSSSTPTRPSSGPRRGRRSYWSGRRPSPRTSTGSSRPRASSRAGAGRPRTPRSSRGASASPASSAAPHSTIYQQSRLLRVGGATINAGRHDNDRRLHGQRLRRDRPAASAGAQGRGLRAARPGPTRSRSSESGRTRTRRRPRPGRGRWARRG